MEISQHIRNVGIIAHIDAGKTTTTEALLFNSGKIHKLGQVDSGNTTTDFLEEEQARGITISSAAVSCAWQDSRINLIDTPGHIDFVAEVERSLRVLDGAIGIFCAVAGVQPQSETVWKMADHYRIPRLIYVNKLDRVGADFTRTLASIRDKLQTKPLVLQLPLGKEKYFQGWIDILEKKAFISEKGSDHLQERALDTQELVEHQEVYEALLDTLSLYDDAILTLYLRGETPPIDHLKRVIKQATLSLQVCPVLIGSSLKNLGTKALLDAVVDYLPSVTDVGTFPALSEGDTSVETSLPIDVQAPLLSLLFKNQFFQNTLLSFIRVYSGALKTGDKVYNARTKKN